MADTCTRAGCTAPAVTRGLCEPHYRTKVAMRVYGYRDATAARAHVLALRELGWTWEQIATAAGTSTTMPHWLASGRTRRILPESERGLLAVPLVPQDSHRGVNSAGTRRRVQALAWMGWPCRDVATRAGTTVPALRTLILPQRRISFTLARRVAGVYDDLALTPGPSRPAASKARRLGFAPPMAWDDGRIDDPRARPCGVRAAVDGAR